MGFNSIPAGPQCGVTRDLVKTIQCVCLTFFKTGLITTVSWRGATISDQQIELSHKMLQHPILSHRMVPSGLHTRIKAQGFCGAIGAGSYLT